MSWFQSTFPCRWQVVEEVVEVAQIIPERIMEHIVLEVPVPQISEEIAEFCSVCTTRARIPKQSVDVLVPLIKEEFVDVVRFIPRKHSRSNCGAGGERIDEHVEQIVAFHVPQITAKIEEASFVFASGAHPRARCGADSGVPRATDHGENRGGASGADSGAHEHIVDPSFPRSAVGSGKRVNVAVTLRSSCLKRRWHGRGKRRRSSFRRCHKMTP